MIECLDSALHDPVPGCYLEDTQITATLLVWSGFFASGGMALSSHSHSLMQDQYFTQSEVNHVATDRIWLCSFCNNKTLEGAR